MAVAKGSAPAIFDLKSASLTLVALVLQTTDLGALAGELARRFGATPDFFSNDPVVIDLSSVRDDGSITTASSLDFTALVALLRGYKMQPVGARGGNEAQMQAALAAGLGEVPDEVVRSASVSVAQGASSQAELVVKTVPPEGEPEPATAAVAGTATAAPTLVVHKPLRSGQQVYARGGDLVVLAAVNFGAEVIADGHIHVYAPLRGKAIAGAKGNTEARIFSTCMEPELVAIAGTYRTTENPLPPEVVGKPAQIRLDGERLVFEALT
ncbi:MAG: septum site-determining protein MinC [Pseudomonadota bacterium]